MEKITHILFSILIFSISIYFFRISYICLFFMIIGATFPDLDLKFYHRKFLHNIWIITPVSAIISYINIPWGISFFIGSISHLVLDSLTPMGIYPLWPINFRIKIKSKIKTGGIRETLFLFIIGIITIILLSNKYKWNIKISVGVFIVLLVYLSIKRKINVRI